LLEYGPCEEIRELLTLADIEDASGEIAFRNPHPAPGSFLIRLRDDLLPGAVFAPKLGVRRLAAASP
jgi:hypothetical protein